MFRYFVRYDDWTVPRGWSFVEIESVSFSTQRVVEAFEADHPGAEILSIDYMGMSA